jgi:hypothetical protein
MPEAKKRFPWWLIVCAALFVLLAAVVGFIETVGRQGTIIGRSERIKPGMPEAEVEKILGPSAFFGRYSWPGTTIEVPVALDRDGPFQVEVDFESVHRPFDWKDLHVSGIELEAYPIEKGEYFTLGWFRVRRWAEQAYTAIHRPRR